MSVQENKELVRRLIEQYNNQRDPEVVEEILAPDYVGHQAPGRTYTKDRVRDFFEKVVPESFPDLEDTILQLVGEGDLVVARMTRSLTFTGDWGSIPATNKSGSFEMCSIFRIAGGQISEQWLVLDSATERKLLGIYGK
jgi:predicted ester cyclase